MCSKSSFKQGKLLCFVNASWVNVFTGEVIPETTFGVWGDKIYFIDFASSHRILEFLEKEDRVGEVIDLKGFFVTPVFIDGHIHIESTHMIPSEFEKFALESGVGKVVCDPHEIGNIFGEEGVRFILENARLLEVYGMIPSCVPASPFETSPGKIGIKDIENLLGHPKVLGLAEVMNFPGVINEEREVIEKIKAVKTLGKLVDGHAPLLRGLSLNKYVFFGVESDHESVEKEEALEKLRLGMTLMVREGTASKNINLLEGLKNLKDLRKVCLVSDDVSGKDLEEYMLKILRKAVRYVSPLQAIQMVTINPAMYFGIEGWLRPGSFASFNLFKNLEKFELGEVWIKGKPLSEQKEFLESSRKEIPEGFFKSMNYEDKKEEDFLIEGFDLEPLEKGKKVRVIKPIEGSLITEELILPFKEVKECLLKGEVNRLYVVERHMGSGRIGKGFLYRFLKEGALASSYAHDSHNVIVAGIELQDIVLAVNRLKEIGGGFVFVRKGKIEGEVSLPVGGIMGISGKEVIRAHEDLERLLEKFAFLKNPLLAMSFFSLSVIPELKLTDQGLIKNFQKVSLFVE